MTLVVLGAPLGPDLHKLAADLHLALNDRGVIVGTRITRITGGGISVDDLVRRRWSQEAVEAVEEAVR